MYVTWKTKLSETHITICKKYLQRMATWPREFVGLIDDTADLILELIEDLKTTGCPFKLVRIRNEAVSIYQNLSDNHTTEPLPMFRRIIQAVTTTLQYETLPIITVSTLLETVIKILKSFCNNRAQTAISNSDNHELVSRLCHLSRLILPLCDNSKTEVLQHVAIICLRKLFRAAKILENGTSAGVDNDFFPHCSMLLVWLKDKLTNTAHPIHAVETLRLVNEVVHEQSVSGTACELRFGGDVAHIVKFTLQRSRYRCTPTWQTCLFHPEIAHRDESLHCDDTLRPDGRVLRRAILLILRLTYNAMTSHSTDVATSIEHFHTIHHMMSDQCKPGSATLAQWVIDLYTEQDSMLCTAIKYILEIQLCLKTDPGFRNQKACAEWIDSHAILGTLLQTLRYDHTVLLDWLISPETEFLHYLTLLLRNIEVIQPESFHTESSDNLEGHVIVLSDGLESVLNYSISSDGSEDSTNDTGSNLSDSQSENRYADDMLPEGLGQVDALASCDQETDRNAKVKLCFDDLFKVISQMSSQGTFPYPVDQLLKLLSKFVR